MPRGFDSTIVHTETRPFPGWAQALDVVTVAGGLAGVLLLLRTGPRFWLGSTFVSLQSPWRALACAAIAAAVRHALLKRPALHERLGAGLVALWRSRSLRRTVTPFGASRGAVLLAAYFALLTIGYPGDRPRPRFSDNQFLNLVVKWDGEWYYNVANEGYRWDDVLPHRARLAFFPAYPMLMRLAGWITGNLVVGGLVVSLAAFLWALTYLFRLAREDIGDADAATAVLLVAFYPFSVFYGAIYTESLFLLATLGCVYHFRRHEWMKASAWGLIVGLARPNGFLLSAVLALMEGERLWRARREQRQDGPAWRQSIAPLIVVSVPVFGVAIYSAFCWSLTGDPLTWMRLHEFWGRGEQTLPQFVSERYMWIRQNGVGWFVAERPIETINLCAAIFAVAAIWPVFRRLGLAYAAFVALMVVPPLVSGTALSVARLTSTLFPLFIWLAVWCRGERRAVLIGTFATLQGFFAVLFFTWRRFY